MKTFDVHTKETAQDASIELLRNTEKTIGFIPNLLGVLADSPVALKAYEDAAAEAGLVGSVIS